MWLAPVLCRQISSGPGYHSERVSTSFSGRALFIYRMIRYPCFKGAFIVEDKALIKISRRKLSRRERTGGLLVSREALPLIFFALGVIGGPFLLTMILLLFLYFLGLAETAAAAVVFWSSAYISYAVLLPLVAGRAIRIRERKQKVIDEMIAFFSTKIVALYSVSEATPAIAEDPRTTEAFTLYLRASQMIETVRNPLNVCETVERGISLVDEVMADYRTSNCKQLGNETSSGPG